MTTRASIHDALINWGAVMRADFRHAVSDLPSPPPTSKQYVCDNQRRGEFDPLPDEPPDEVWAEEVQKGITRLAGTGFDKVLQTFYRDRKPDYIKDGKVIIGEPLVYWPKHVLEEAQNKLWGML